jgi:hypothetical protein
MNKSLLSFISAFVLFGVFASANSGIELGVRGAFSENVVADLPIPLPPHFLV